VSGLDLRAARYSDRKHFPRVMTRALAGDRSGYDIEEWEVLDRIGQIERGESARDMINMLIQWVMLRRPEYQL
jgi:uncharacterized protein YifE (UPF0438 family)